MRVIFIHQLRYLPDNVIKMGPLWVFCSFKYENFYGQFLKLVHEIQYKHKIPAHEQCIKMIRLIDEMSRSSIHTFCLSKKRQKKIIKQIFQNCYSIHTE